MPPSSRQRWIITGTLKAWHYIPKYLIKAKWLLKEDRKQLGDMTHLPWAGTIELVMLHCHLETQCSLDSGPHKYPAVWLIWETFTIHKSREQENDWTSQTWTKRLVWASRKSFLLPLIWCICVVYAENITVKEWLACCRCLMVGRQKAVSWPAEISSRGFVGFHHRQNDRILFCSSVLLCKLWLSFHNFISPSSTWSFSSLYCLFTFTILSSSLLIL